MDNSLNLFFVDELPCLSEQSVKDQLLLTNAKRLLNIYRMFKTPGLDGLPKEFYAFAFKYIGKVCVRFLNRWCCEGLLPFSQRQGVITLICKDPTNADSLKH